MKVKAVAAGWEYWFIFSVKGALLIFVRVSSLGHDWTLKSERKAAKALCILFSLRSLCVVFCWSNASIIVLYNFPCFVVCHNQSGNRPIHYSLSMRPQTVEPGTK